MAEKKEKQKLKELGLDKKKKKKVSKVTLTVLLVIVLAVGIWVARYLIKYVNYNDYKQYLTDYEYEASKGEFKAVSDSSPSVEGMKLAAENANLKLYVNVETGETAVYDKRNQTTVYSNPPEADQDSVANGTNKNYLKSQIILEFFNAQRLESIMDSYSYCVELGQLKAESIDNGIRFVYTMGDMSSATGIVPTYISQEALDKVVAALDAEKGSYVKKKFKASKELEGTYELLSSAMKGASQIRNLNNYFEEAGFTLQDYEEQMLAAGVEDAVPTSFTIPLEYRLLEDSVEVSIPVKAIEENGGGAVHRIQVLNFFAAGSKDEEGYMLVPNGSGSLIDFNNGKGKLVPGNDYQEYIYGEDPLSADYTVKEITEDSKLGLFGVFRENSAVFATIEDGATLASVTANVGGEVNEYNNVYATFTLRGNDTLEMFGTTGSEADLPIVEKSAYDSNLKVRFTMLTGEYASYAGAANYYRTRLMNEGVLTANQAEGDIKYYYDVLGGVERTKYFLGTQYRGLYAMTTFEEAESMAKELTEAGVNNQVMNYQGWSNGGYYHDVLDKIKVPYKLGGKSGLEELSKAVQDAGGTFYIDTAFQQVTYVSSRYSKVYETSRYYGGGYIAQFGLVNPTTLRNTSSLGYSENHYFLISPKFLVKYTGKFADKIQNYDVQGISLRDLGDEIHSDKKRTNVINREEALEVVLGQLDKLEATGKKLMVDDGNDYSFAYASDIINAPLTDNDYFVIDETVPFYEMLIHGCIDYSGAVINLGNTTDMDLIVLNLIETGASPHFKFSWQNSNELKETGISRMYSTTFSKWKDESVEIYKRTNEVLSQVNGAFITDHKADGEVSVTTYSNGVKIYVNKGAEDSTIDGVTVPARDYYVGR